MTRRLPTPRHYLVESVFFSLVSLLPRLVPRGWTGHLLAVARRCLEQHARTIALVLLILLAASLLRNGIAGLTD
ncbi:MAG TPA: hypothetical protein VF025_03330 [Gaiellaceae bacterium]